MRVLSLGLLLMLGSTAVLVGCGGGGGGGGGGSPAVVYQALSRGINESFRPPTRSQQFSTNAAAPTDSGNSDLRAETTAYTFGATGAASTISTVRSPGDGSVTFLFTPYSPSPLSEFDFGLTAANSSASVTSTFVFTQASRISTTYQRVGVGSAVPNAPPGSDTTQIARIGTVKSGPSGSSESLIISDWANTTPVGPLSTGLNLSHTIFGRWAQSVATPASGLSDRVGVFAFGSRVTQGTDMPATGSATYTGGFLGVYFIGAATSGAGSLPIGNNGKYDVDGFVTLTVTNFATGTGTFATSSTRIFATGLGGAPGVSSIQNNLNVSGSVTLSGNTVSGNLTAPGQTSIAQSLAGTSGGAMSGSMQGQFYGPNAQEVGGTFRLGSATTGQLRSEELIGAFGAKR